MCRKTLGVDLWFRGVIFNGVLKLDVGCLLGVGFRVQN